MEDLTYELREICKAIAELGERYLNEDILEDEKQNCFSIKKWCRIADMGIFALPFSKELGGLGETMFTTALSIQTLSRKCKDEGLVFSVVAQLAATQVPLAYYGTEEQIENYLKPIMAGKYIGSSVISEPEAGSDTGNIKATVHKKDDIYTLNGVKTFATLAPVADVLIVYVKHPNGIRMLDTSAFILKKGEFQIGQEFEKVGLKTSPMSEVILNNVQIDKNRLLGRERQAMNIFMDAMLWEKILVAAYHVGSMQSQYEEVYQYATNRKQFQKNLLQFDRITDKLIEMKRNIENCRLLLYHVCHLFDKGEVKKSNAAMLKMQTSECKIQNSLLAVSIFGAYGVLQEGTIEKQMRDSLPANIYSGTQEMQKKIIAEDLGDFDEW